MAAGRGSPRCLPLAEQPLQEALSVKKKEMENFWDGVLAGFGGITWSGVDLARGTAQARAYERKHSLHHLCLGASQCSREQEILSSHSKNERKGKLPVTQVLRCLTAIRCAVLATCFAHPTPVTSFPQLFPAGGAGPEAPLHHGATQVFCKVTGMWHHPLFLWIEGRARGGRGSSAALGACSASGRRVLPQPRSGLLCGCW